MYTVFISVLISHRINANFLSCILWKIFKHITLLSKKLLIDRDCACFSPSFWIFNSSLVWWIAVCRSASQRRSSSLAKFVQTFVKSDFQFRLTTFSRTLYDPQILALRSSRDLKNSQTFDHFCRIRETISEKELHLRTIINHRQISRRVSNQSI